jgi:pimeloyl-ACP methyl ester carboxylesterase
MLISRKYNNTNILVIRQQGSASMTWINDYVHANGIRQHFTRTGGEKPPILLLHGLTDNGLYWTTIAQDLEHDYDLIMPDARGHGLSDPVGPASSWVDNAEDAASLIQQLGLKRPGVIGHSIGAATAGILAALHPELVSYLVLEDPPLFDQNPDSQSTQDRFAFGPWEQSLELLKSKPRSEQLAIARNEHLTWPDIELERWIDSKNQFDLATFRAITRPSLDWRNVIAKIQCPVLLVTGEPERGAIITPRIAEEIVSLLPYAHVIYIPGAGHSIRFDQHDAYLEAISGFLHKHRGNKKTSGG